MTQLEIILIISVWIFYGLFAIKQTDFLESDLEELEVGVYVLKALFIIYSPLLFLMRALYGAFKKYK